MARHSSIVGFETGNIAYFTAIGAVADADLVLDPALARTGNYCFRSRVTVAAVGHALCDVSTLANTVITGDVYDFRGRIHFLNVTRPSANHCSVGGFGGGNAQVPSLTLEMNTVGAVRLVDATGAGTAYSGAVLTIGQWYRADLHVVGSDATLTRVYTIDIYEEGATGPLVSLAVPQAYALATICPSYLFIGQTNTEATHPNCTREFRYDDAYFDCAFGGDVSVWPKPTKVHPFAVIGQGSFDQFTPASAWANVAEIPWDPVGVYVQNSTPGQKSTYRHADITGNEKVWHVRVYSVAGNNTTPNPENLLLGADAFSKSVTSSGPFHHSANKSYTDAPIKAPAFAALEIGWAKVTAGNTLVITQMMVEALVELDLTEVAYDNREIMLGLVWVEFTDSLGTTRAWSKIPLPDPASYYTGWKDGRVLQWGSIRRAFSDYMGQYESTDFTWIQADTDRLVRGLLESESTRYFFNRQVVIRMISDADRRLLKIPRTVVRGVLKNYSPLAPLKFQFNCQDILTRKFSPRDDRRIPTRLITLDDFPQANALKTDASGSSTPIAAAGLAVPIIYGSMSDRQMVEIPGPVLTRYTYDASIRGPKNAATVTIPGATWSGDYPFFAVASVIGDRMSMPIMFDNTLRFPGQGSTVGPTYDERVIWDIWPGVPPPDAFLVFMYPPSTWNPITNPNAPGVRYKVVAPVVTNPAPPPDVPPGTPNADEPWAYSVDWNSLTDGDVWPPTIGVTTSGDVGHGLCPAIYVGDQVVGGTSYHKFLIAGHACKTLHDLYVLGVPQRLQQDPAQAGAGGIWIVPGYANWLTVFGNANLFEDINGRRYYVVYGKVGVIGPDIAAGVQDAPSNSTNVPRLMVNVDGIEDEGDGSGDLITNVLVQYRHCVLNFILGTYAAGAWLAAPTYLDGQSMIDEASFDTASAIKASIFTGGYVGAFILGSNNDRLSVRDLVALFNLSSDVQSGFNRLTQFFVSSQDNGIGQLQSSTPLSDVLDIIKDSFVIEDLDGEFFNVVPYTCARDYSGASTSGWLVAGEVSDPIAIAKLANTSIGDDGRKPSQEIPLAMIRNPAIAADIADRRLLFSKDTPRRVTFKVGMPFGLSLELGNAMKLSHYGGIGAGGWVNRPVRITRHETNPDDFTVTLEGYDMRRIFEGGFILGDEAALPASWPLATAEQKVYGALSDEATGLFSTGEIGKRFR